MTQAPLLHKRRGAPRWVVSFADLMSLLLALFVMFLSFSEINSDSFKRNAGPISEAFLNKSIISIQPTAYAPVSTDTISLEEQKKLEEVYEREEAKDKFISNLKKIMAFEIENSMAELMVQGDSVIIRFPDKAAFASGSMELSEAILPAIDRIADSLSRAEGDILVSGHTDNQPISTSQFRSNWDLSTDRAVSVVHRLLKDGLIASNRVTAMGFGDSRPLKSNDTQEGRSINRRVEITIKMEGKTENVKVKEAP